MQESFQEAELIGGSGEVDFLDLEITQPEIDLGENLKLLNPQMISPRVGDTLFQTS